MFSVFVYLLFPPLEREANKKNTHYLSDGIIRKCLNIGGTNERERGYYFDISNENPFVEFNFQRIDEVNLDMLEFVKENLEER